MRAFCNTRSDFHMEKTGNSQQRQGCVFVDLRKQITFKLIYQYASKNRNKLNRLK